MLPGVLQSAPIQSKPDSLRLVLEKSTDDSTRLYLLKTLSDYWEHHNNDSAVYYGKKAFHKAEKLDDSFNIASISGRLGVFYMISGNNQQAMYYLQKALSVAKRNNYTKVISNSYNNIGNVFKYEEDYERALEQYFYALDINTKNDHKIGIADNMNNIAVTYRMMGDLENAIDYFNKSYLIYKQLDDLAGIANSYNNIGIIYFTMNKPDLALKAFYNVAQIRKDLNQYLGYGNILFNISFILDHMGEYEKAKEKALESFDQARLTSSLPLKRLCYVKLVDICKNLGNYEQAYQYHEKFFVVADSLYSIRKQEKLIELKSQFFVEKERYEIDLLEKENLLIENNITRLNTYMAISGTILVLLLGFSIIIFQNNRTSTKRNNLLEERNQLMTKQRNEYASQRDEIQKYNEQLNAQQVEIVKQKEILENKTIALEKAVLALDEKNEKIKSSLRYAGSLLKTMEPGIDSMRDCFAEVVLYKKQKHEVFNCFYWINNNDRYSLIAFIDNHNDGVSGAFVMILINDLLNRLAKNKKNVLVKRLINNIETGVNSQGIKYTEYLSNAFDNISLNIIKVDKKSLQIHFAGKDLPFIYNSEKKSDLIDPDKNIDGAKYYAGSLLINKEDLVILPNYNGLKYFVDDNKSLKPIVQEIKSFPAGDDKSRYLTRLKTYLDVSIEKEPCKGDVCVLCIKV